MTNGNKRLILNTVSGIVRQVVTVICGFILPSFFLNRYGSEVNGLITSMTQFLGFITLLEMGIGPVIQANLYKPLADNDINRISEIVKSAERFFKRIAYVFLAYIVVLSIVFPTTIAAGFDAFFTISLLIIIAISTIAQYFFGATYQVLLNADQKSYIQMGLQTIAILLNTILSVVLIRWGASIHIVKLVSASIFILRPIGQMIYVKKNYPLNKKIELEGEPISQKWNGIAQHVATTVSADTSTVILSFFSSLSNLSIYSVYNLVTNGLTNIIATGFLGVDSYFGHIIAKRDEQDIKKSFEMVEFVTHGIVTVIFAIAGMAIIPFVTIYTYNVNDANYIQPFFGMILVAAYGVRCIRMPYHSIVNAAGHFKQTQAGSFIMAAVNIIVSIILVIPFGLVGIATGLFLSMAFHTIYFVWYLRSNIINRPMYVFVKYLVLDTAIVVVSVLVSRIINLGELTWITFFFYLIKCGLLTLGIAVLMNILFNFKMVKASAEKLLFKPRNK